VANHWVWVSKFLLLIRTSLHLHHRGVCELRWGNWKQFECFVVRHWRVCCAFILSVCILTNLPRSSSFIVIQTSDGSRIIVFGVRAIAAHYWLLHYCLSDEVGPVCSWCHSSRVCKDLDLFRASKVSLTIINLMFRFFLFFKIRSDFNRFGLKVSNSL
jgi:hypothetical protein